MSTIRITTSQNIELEYDLSSVGERIIAYVIDFVILASYFIFMAIILLNGAFSHMSESLYYLFYLPVIFYHVLSEMLMNGQTVGKKAMRIRIISLEGGSANLGQHLIRWVFRLIDFTSSFGLVALVSVAVSVKRQRLGDMVAGTTLVKTVPRTTFQETLYVPKVADDYRVQFPSVESLSDTDMQLIKEVIINVRKSGNSMLALQASEKIEQTLGVNRGHMEPMQFLLTLLADYNSITSKV